MSHFHILLRSEGSSIQRLLELLKRPGLQLLAISRYVPSPFNYHWGLDLNQEQARKFHLPRDRYFKLFRGPRIFSGVFAFKSRFCSGGNSLTQLRSSVMLRYITASTTSLIVTEETYSFTSSALYNK